MRHKEDRVRSSPHRSAEAGLDDSRGHTVHPYVAVSQVGGQGPGETQQRRLTHTVRTEALSGTHTINVHAAGSILFYRMTIIPHSCPRW